MASDSILALASFISKISLLYQLTFMTDSLSIRKMGFVGFITNISRRKDVYLEMTWGLERLSKFLSSARDFLILSRLKRYWSLYLPL
jgi:hypothetical protein